MHKTNRLRKRKDRKEVECAQGGAQRFFYPLPSPKGEADIYNRNDRHKDTSGREIMTAVQDEPDNRSERSLNPSLTGERMLDNILEKLRRTLEARAKREAVERSAPASERTGHDHQAG